MNTKYLDNLLQAKDSLKIWMANVEQLHYGNTMFLNANPSEGDKTEFANWYYGEGQTFSSFDAFKQLEPFYNEMYALYDNYISIFNEPAKKSLFSNQVEKKQKKLEEYFENIKQTSRKLIKSVEIFEDKLKTSPLFNSEFQNSSTKTEIYEPIRRDDVENQEFRTLLGSENDKLQFLKDDDAFDKMLKDFEKTFNQNFNAPPEKIQEDDIPKDDFAETLEVIENIESKPSLNFQPEIVKIEDENQDIKSIEVENTTFEKSIEIEPTEISSELLENQTLTEKSIQSTTKSTPDVEQRIKDEVSRLKKELEQEFEQKLKVLQNQLSLQKPVEKPKPVIEKPEKIINDLSVSTPVINIDEEIRKILS